MDEAAVGCDASVRISLPMACATGANKPADQVLEVRVGCVIEIGMHGLQEVVYDTSKKRIRADLVPHCASKCRLKCADIARAKALGQLHNASDRVADLHDGHNFRHFLHVLGHL